MKTLLDHNQLNMTLRRLAHQLVENHLHFRESAIIGIQPRGVWLSDRIAEIVKQITGQQQLDYGKLDITFYRDDVHQGGVIVPSQTDIPFTVEDRKVILIDDVLFTGRTIRSAMDALLDFGRPRHVELMVLVDRRLSRELPIEPNYVGVTVDTISSQKVKVNWKEKDDKDEVVLIDQPGS